MTDQPSSSPSSMPSPSSSTPAPSSDQSQRGSYPATGPESGAGRSGRIGRSDTGGDERGTVSIADSVVAKIAGVACREISGVHNMGTGGSRLFGAVKERMPGTPHTPDAGQGVSVEVGEIEAAVDLDVVVDYGVAIPDVARAIRENVIRRIETMTGLQVTEVNISVDDVYLGEELAEPEPEPRVQ